MAGYCGIGPGLRFRGTNCNYHWRYVTRDLRFQGILARLGIVSRLVDDRRCLRRNRYRWDSVTSIESAWRRTRQRLVWSFCCHAGIGDCVDLVDSNFAESDPWRTTTDLTRHSRFCLHRLDVRSPRISRQRNQRLRLCLLHNLRNGTVRRRGLHFREDLRSSSVAERDQPEQDVGGRAGRVRSRHDSAVAS